MTKENVEVKENKLVPCYVKIVVCKN